MKTALVTGANGFIGSFLVERLIKEGFDVRCFVRETSNLRWIKDLPVKFYYGALLEPETLVEPLKDVEYVFHTAAKKRAFAEAEYNEVNHFGTLNLLEACKNAGSIKRFIYVSSLAVTGPNPKEKPWTEDAPCNPISFYGSSKLKGEEDVRKYNSFFPVTIIRPPAVYGPRDTDLLPIFKAVKWGIKPKLGIRKRIMSIVYVDDLIGAISHSSQSEVASGKTYFVCSKNYYPYDEIVERISFNLNKRAISIKIPSPLIYVAAFINQVFARIRGKAAVLNIQKAGEMTKRFWICSPNKIEKELGIVAKTSLDEGIKKTIDWYKSNKYL